MLTRPKNSDRREIMTPPHRLSLSIALSGHDPRFFPYDPQRRHFAPAHERDAATCHAVANFFLSSPSCLAFGKLVLRTYKEDEQEEQKPKGRPNKK
jgi:hypothetical protein